MTRLNKKLIEIALPLEAINRASAHEKLIKVGKPTNLHLWWARRPMAAARAIIFAQMVDDPSAHPELFKTVLSQEVERQRLFRLIEKLVEWDNTANEKVLQQARREIERSWRLTCGDNTRKQSGHFDPAILPGFHDPFAGGGVLPLEAQRLGLESFASDLNPVAVLINKAMIEFPPRFAGRPPACIASTKDRELFSRKWHGAEGLAADVLFYGQWIRDRAQKRIGRLYPEIEVTAELVKGRPDLKPYLGGRLTVIAWIWARTVKSPNPAFAAQEVPLASTYLLSSKVGKEAYVEPVVNGKSYRFVVKIGKPKVPEAVKLGSRSSQDKGGFSCLLSGVPIPFDYVRSEYMAGRVGARLLGVVAEGQRGRIYLSPTDDMTELAATAKPEWSPDVEFFKQALGFRVGGYGMSTWADLFTPRQLVALTTLSDLVQEARIKIAEDAAGAGLHPDARSLAAGGSGSAAYSDAVAVYLGLALSRVADWNNTLSRWESKAQVPQQLFGRQVVSMTWDYSEANPLSSSTGSFMASIRNLGLSFTKSSAGHVPPGHAVMADACSQSISAGKVISTDPPYYDNIGYADLSDFFYVWLRRTLRPLMPELFGTVAVPKAEELVATPERHGGKDAAEKFFLAGMSKAMQKLAEQAHPAFPITIYYAFKQSEADGEDGTASTGWETFLDAVIRAGLAVCGTWPLRTENESRLRGQSSNALASSIVLVCRKRSGTEPGASRSDFARALKAELPAALANLQRGNIAPVDLAQAAIGPGMAVYTRFARVLDAEGRPVSVRDALSLINQTLDEALAEQEGDFDADSRWALAWFGDHGFEAGPFGDAHTYFIRFNTAENGLKAAGIIESGRSKVRLLRPTELAADWDPTTDTRLTAWEVVHHLIRALSANGESGAATLVATLGTRAETARELAYRLYTLCERKKRAPEALSYNALVQSWPEISRLAREGGKPPQGTQAGLFDKDGE
jgi:putative DNA methylase